MSLAMSLALSGCAANRVPEGWPTQRELAREARLALAGGDAAAPRAIAAALRQDALGIHAPLSPRLAARIATPEGTAALARAADRLAALGRLRGALDRGPPAPQVTGDRWTETLLVYGRGRKAVPLMLELRWTDGGAVDRLVLRRHRWAASLGRPPDADRLPLHRYSLPVAGTWDVLHGGPDPDGNRHHGHPEQHYAVDLVIREHGRVRPPASSEDNASHHAHGQRVLAPAPGVVVRVVDGRPDTPPGDAGSGGGNGLIIDHGGGEFSSLWHLLAGSLEVEVGDEVARGQSLGRVGNSGASTLPHLHWHLGSGWGPRERVALPIWLRDVEVDGTPTRWVEPTRGQRLSPARDPADAPERLGDPPMDALWLDL